MSTAIGLPPALRAKLASVARRIRLLRAARGLSLLVLVTVLLIGGVFLVDLALGLTQPALAVALALLAAATSLIVLFGVVVPLSRALDPEALAAIIEEKYPELGERLTSTVELAGHPETAHGSAALIALLVHDTALRAGPLDFGHAISGRTSQQLATAAAIALLLLLIPGLFLADQAADFGRRLFTSWTPAATVEGPGYTLTVHPGDVFAARGRPLTLTAKIAQQRDGVTLPVRAFLITAGADGKNARVPMQPESAGAFSFKMESVPGDLSYQVEAGVALSPSYKVTAIEPVELLPQSPTVLVVPPVYVNPDVHSQQTFNGATDLSALQYSGIRFDFRFTRPAALARIELSRKPAEPSGTTGNKTPDRAPESLKEISPWQLPVQFGDDRLQGRFEMPALAKGEYEIRLHLEAEHNISTEVDLRTLRIWTDEPPAFTEVPKTPPSDATAIRAGWAIQADPLGNKFDATRLPAAIVHGKVATPDDTLRLKVAVEDKVGVDRGELEYRVNEGPSQFATMFQANGLPKGGADFAFALAGKVKDGDVVFYRLRSLDNRKVAAGSFLDPAGVQVPAAALNRQIVYHPARDKDQDRWFVLKIDRQAVPLQEQEIVAQREEVRKKIEEIQQKLRTERADLDKTRTESRKETSLTQELAKNINAVHKENRDIRGDLRELARETAATPALQPLADRAREVADNEMTKSDEDIARAENKKADERAREENLQKADQELASAQRRLDDLTRLNERVAQDRLDQLKMERLAKRENELADKTAHLAEKDHAKDPAARAQLDEVKAEQARVADELRQLTDQSKLFKEAVNAARVEEAKKLADEAKELARAQRDLNEAEKATFKKENDAKFEELVKKQQDLADDAAKLAKKTNEATKAMNAPPLRADEAQKAADALRDADLTETLKRQDQAAKDLERVAADLDKAVELARDPREAARQLARLQDNLYKKLGEEVKKKDDFTPLPERFKEIRKEEQAIQKAVQNLELPPNNPAAEAARKQAAEAAQRAAEDLKRELPHQTPREMIQARQALERLANSLPSLEQRKQRALQELGQLRREQEDIARKADEAVKQADKKPDAVKQDVLAKALADTPRRQASVAERLSKMDVPQQPARHENAQQALNKALNDLVRAKPEDIKASQEQAKQQLEKLADALAGKKSPAERARDLAQEQKKLNDDAAHVAGDPRATPEQTKGVEKRQDDIAKATEALPAKDAPEQKQAAAQATKDAAQAAKAQPKEAGTQEKMAAAAKALDKLADQLGEQEAAAHKPAGDANESPRQMAQKLAKEQRQLGRATQQAAQQAASKPGPQGKQALDKAMEKLAGEQAKLEQKASELPANKAQTAMQEARQAMNQARQALEKGDAGQAQYREMQAAQALDKLARALPEKAPQTSQAKGSAEPPEGVPQRQQAKEARTLAKAQKALHDEVAKLAGEAAAKAQQAPLANPVGELARQQAEIARESADLAKDVAKEQGAQAQPAQQADKAAQAAQQAAQKAQTGALPQAQEAGKQTAQQLRKLAQDLTDTPRGNAEPGAPDPVQRAVKLAEKQEALSKQMEPLAGNADAQKAQQQARQHDLEKQTDQLAKGLGKLAQESGFGQVHQARNAAEQAEAAMQQAQAQAKMGNEGQAQQAGQQAAQKLDEAAQAAQQAAQQAAGQQPGQPESAAQKAGEAIQQGQQQTAQAQQQLNQGQPHDAQAAMQKAAQAMHEAAKSAMEAMEAAKEAGMPSEQNKFSGIKGAAPVGMPDLSKFGKDMKKYAGRTWGELPGELRTRILQDMRARYGEDYARIIQRYFEQIADTRKQ
jgi:hypothetical protein